MSDKKFDEIVDHTFENIVNVDRYEVISKKYKIWIANGYGSFSINGVKGFSLAQKIRFFRRVDKYLLDGNRIE